jgi:hypothetical protein
MTNSMVYLWAVEVWFVFLVIAFGVGAVREGLLRPRIGEPKAHVIGTLIAVALMNLVIYAFIQRIHGSCSMTDLILIGVLWLVMTVAFEFGFFHFIMGKPWEALLADYNILRGRIWVLVLATVLLGPIIVGMLMKRSHETVTPTTLESSPTNDTR